MPDSWDFYLCRVNDAPASIYLNMGLHAKAPLPTHPTLLWVWVTMNHPRSDGLSSQEEFKTLVAIEDTLNSTLTALGVVWVGRNTTAGRREFYYYASGTDGLGPAVEGAMRAYPTYRFELGHKHDPGWAQYLDFLYPGAESRQQMENRPVIEALEAEGDPLTISRPVSHWLYFPTTEARTGFLNAVSGQGFQVAPGSLSTATDQTRPYGVQLERRDPVDWASINDLTSLLMKAAASFDGDYDGWETEIVTLPRPSLKDRLLRFFRRSDA